MTFVSVCHIITNRMSIGKTKKNAEGLAKRYSLSHGMMAFSIIASRNYDATREKAI